MNKNEVQAAFEAAGLTRLLKDLDALSKPSIRLSTTSAVEEAFAIGTSKVGGLPDLPVARQWPEWKGIPQSFIAQIRMEDVQPYDIANVLPKSGMLWFFYDAKQEIYGESIEDKEGWQVFFEEEITHLQRAPAPTTLPTTSRFQACGISITSEITLSQNPQLEVPNLDWTEEEQKKYEDFLATFPSKEDHGLVHHRLLGNPDTIQDDMRLQCQLVTHNVKDVTSSQATELAKTANEWQLLLQIDTDAEANMEWANNGMLYYWITASDLHEKHFANTWLILQSE